jgi:hypothetical protein
MAENYVEELTVQSFTDNPQWNPITNTYIAAANFSVSTKYLIVASGRWGGDTASANTGMDVYDDSDSIFAVNPDTRSGAFGHQVYTTNGDLRDYLFVGEFTTNASGLSGNLTMESYHDGQYDTSYADQMSLLTIDLDDLGSGNYVEDSDYTGYTDIGSSMEDLVEVTGLSAGKTYLVLGCARFLTDTSSSDIIAQLIDGGSNVKAYHRSQSVGGNEAHIVGFMGVVTGQTSAKIQAQAGTGWDLLQAYMIAIDTAAFANFDYNFSGTGSTITSTDEELLSATSIATRTSANHLFLGRFNYTNSGSEARTSASVKTGASSYGSATETRSGDISVFGTQESAATNAEQVNVMAVQTFTGGASNNVYLGGGRNGSDSDPTSEYEFVAVLDFTPSGGATYAEVAGASAGDTIDVVGDIDAIVEIDAHTVPAPG